VWVRAPGDASAYARTLYANLRTLDAANADTILIEQVPAASTWAAIRDRLARATSGETDDRD
jgi:L-threonylcarbamoyladenylate synthase